MTNILEALSDNIKVDKSKCIFCGKCTEACVVDNVRLKLSPCRRECPLKLNCQGYVQLIERGEIDKALETVYDTTPFAGVLGRICHHPCEQACTRKEVDGQAVAIRELKRFLADNATIPAVGAPEIENGKSVGIIGGGPAGAMAAYLLRKQGFKVVVYEAGSRLGGMMAYHIPEFRLPEDVLAREMNQLVALGVEVRYNTVVGKDMSFGKIQASHDYVVIATGTHVSKKLNMAGEDLPNVYDALSFLRGVKGAVKPQVGKRVVVIGGGNTAVNAAQTALRLGAESVRVLALECRETLPAFETEVTEALTEGILFDCGWGPARFVEQGGRVVATEFKRCLAVCDRDGRFDPLFAEGERMEVAADTVIVAIGQAADTQLADGTGVAVEKGLIAVDPVTRQTALPRVFAAGDIVTGPKSVVEALTQGREAAESIWRDFLGLPMAYERDRTTGFDTEYTVDLSQAIPGPRAKAPTIDRSARRGFAEIEKSLTRDQALAEGKRCLSCGEPYGKYRMCWSCLACEVECPEKAIDISVPYLVR
jgi:NADPH-dependent glutamate synthase beta subunit-like oxidoreductase